jgi:hypothetical protein
MNWSLDRWAAKRYLCPLLQIIPTYAYALLFKCVPTWSYVHEYHTIYFNVCIIIYKWVPKYVIASGTRKAVSIGSGGDRSEEANVGGTACLSAAGGKISLVRRNVGTQLFIMIKSKLQNTRGISVIPRILVERFTAICTGIAKCTVELQFRNTEVRTIYIM